MRLVFFLFVLLSSGAFGQYELKGKVIDAISKEPLPFVNIVSLAQNQGTTTDLDGLFTIHSNQPVKSLKLSYVGYETKEIAVTNQKIITIALNNTSYDIAEFKVLPEVNPAERIIKEVIKNRKKHNPEKNLDFKYKTYSKMYFSAILDSLFFFSADTVEGTDNQEMLDWMEDHYLFMMESVTERKYKRPDKSYEKVIATRVSGLKNPTFALIATELQSFSFYNPVLKLLDNSYVNPISENSISKYLFLIEDTVAAGTDTVFVLSFQPRKGKNFDALKGLLYINTGGFALQNVIAEPAHNDEMISIKIQQQYKKIEGHWFPVQLNSDLILDMYEGGVFKTLGVNRTYLRNIEINPELSNRAFSNVVTEINEEASKKTEQFWEENRVNPLTEKETNTYTAIDSLGAHYHFEQKMTFFENLGEGKINWGIIDFDVNQLFGANKYEGLRFGGGIRTSNKLSQWFNLGGYGAYGFRDREEKYGGDINFLLNKRTDVEMNFFYQKDVEEPGVVDFTDYKIPMFSTAGNRRFFNLDRMNNVEKIGAKFQFRTLRYLKVYVAAQQENVTVTNDYYYMHQNKDGFLEQDQDYQFNELGIELRYAFKEKVAKYANKKYTIASKYPILYAKVEHGVNDFDGDFEYTRFTFRAEKKFFIQGLGYPKFYVETGLINGDVPQHKLNSSLGSLTLWDASKTINVSTENAFETMLPYEFFSSEYVHLHFRHSFGNLLFKYKKFEPEFVVTSSVGFGSLANMEAHGGVNFKTMEEGFYESGLVINNILRFYYFSFGAGAFYRYGPYSFDKASDNLALKMSLGFVIPKKFKFQ